MAIIKTKTHRNAAISGIKSFKEKNNVHGHLFSVEAIEALMKQPDIKHIKVNYSYDKNGETKAILHGVDINGDIMPDLLAESPLACPPQCENNTLA
jgi:hypothetical protein